ncbi:MAG: transcription-repair coupling factor [Deltaproteobacteria bacterium]|nr:transcription-repair coupling factor [Deltaproteobacteria bacterium]
MDLRVWDRFARTLRSSAPYRALVATGGDVVRLPLPAAAWVLSLLRQDQGGSLLVVVPRESDALAWVEAVKLFSAEDSATYFPAPSLTPYQEAETSLMVRAQESVALDEVLRGKVGAVVCTPRALFRRLPGKQDFLSAIVELEAGSDLLMEELLRHLVRFGYRRTDLVSEVGELAVRGGVFDLFPPGRNRPVRLDLFGDTVESIRSFDPTTQRSEERIDKLRVLPLGLFPAGLEEASVLGQLMSEISGPEIGTHNSDLIRQLTETGRFPGWENFLPLMAPHTTALNKLLTQPFVVAVDPTALLDEAEHHAETLNTEFELRLSQARLSPPPEELEIPLAEVTAILESAEIRVRSLGIGVAAGSGVGLGADSEVGATGGQVIDFAATTTESFQGHLPRFPSEVATVRARGELPIVVVDARHRDRLRELLEARELSLDDDAGVQLAEGHLQRGFRIPCAGLSVYSEHQLFGRLAPIARRGKSKLGPFIAGMRDLKVGDYVVHSDHGIGQFVSLRVMGGEVEPQPGLPPALRSAAAPASGGVEVMEIVYKSGKTLLLPLSRLDQVQKYSGIEGVAPRLDALGGTSWNRTKQKVRKSLRDMAGELLKLYAERQLARAPRMAADSDLVGQFEAAFEFEETEDQLEAIVTIKKDLQGELPMDRLLCGDVGYGKTEVAMRAAFKAVDAGYQVAVLAPTTILADQHLETFQRRFADFPVQIEMISRFRTPAQVKEIAEKLAADKIDVLIGTHRILSKKLKFANLGLMIVDEEQRFGVAQKERLKQLKKDVHVLAMSATPVPRTLQLSLAGVRDLSVIETPPKDRMAVETAILPFTADLIREAIEFELERGGQVYFVYNRVETIEGMQSYLRELVPTARITVGHGQLEEQELSKRMHAFTAGEYDVLLATTIIENGIDIPNVNTMIVNNADRFGLAQLYQLRGRVGRSNQLAYCYLLIPADRVPSETARKRLSAIREFSDLGAGFRIAARDLEIRGAGNLLGTEQSGHIAAVGIETYLKMLESSVRELRGEDVSEGPSTAIDLPVSMSIPEQYVSDANLRMEIYRRIASSEEPQDDLLAELADRFGAPPPSVHALLEVAGIKRQAEALRVQSVSCRNSKLVFRLRQDTRVDIDVLIEAVGRYPGATFSPTGALTLPAAAGSEVLRQARELLDSLATSREGAEGTDGGGGSSPAPMTVGERG